MTATVQTPTPQQQIDELFFITVLERPSCGHRVRPQGAVKVHLEEPEPIFTSPVQLVTTRVGVADIEQAIVNCIQAKPDGREEAAETLRRRTLDFLRQHSADMIRDKRDLGGQLRQLYKKHRFNPEAHATLDYVGTVAQMMDA